MTIRANDSAPAIWRHAALTALLIVLGIFLTSCSTGSDVFSPESGGNPSGKTVPPVMWKGVTGLPADKLQTFKDTLASVAGQRDIGIVEGEFQSGTYALSGSFQTGAGSGGGSAWMSFTFTLHDDHDALVDTISGSEDLGPAVDIDAAITPAVLQRIAEAVSQHMADRLAQLGFATRRADLTRPPAYLFARAGPGAEYDVDLETLNGPSAVEPVAADAASGEVDVAAAEPVAEPVPDPLPAAPKSGSVEINSVAVVPVQGATGPGNTELTAAMRRTLASVGWPVVNSRRADALVIRGRVDMSAPLGVNQRVAVRWVVETPEGKSLGDVKQANNVPSGSLDAGWGEAATIVAEAAASGIFDIIKRYR